MLLATDAALVYPSGKSPLAIHGSSYRIRKAKLKTIALLCTDESLTGPKIVALFIHGWVIEVTFHEGRAHLGVKI